MIIAMESLRETICKNFNRILSEHPEYGPSDIAEAAGVHRSMIYKWKDGENLPEPEKMEALAKLFRIDVMEFYKTGAGVISIQPSRALKKYLVIPDEVVELACHLDANDEVWEGIIEELKLRLDEIHIAKS